MTRNGCSTFERTAGFDVLKLFRRFLEFTLWHRPDTAALGRDVPFPTALWRTLLGTDVAGLGVHRLLFDVQQPSCFDHISHVRCCGRDRVHQPRFCIHADVRFHAEVPLLTLARLVHLRIACLRFVLRRGWGVNDRRVDDRALAQQQSLVGQVRIDRPQHLRCQIVGFQQMPEVQNGGLVGYAAAGQ